MTEHNGLLLILLDVDNHLVVIGYWIVDTLGSLLWHWDRREDFLDYLLHLINVEIANNDDGLQIGAIPLLIVVAQVIIREVVYNVHRADRHAVFVLGTFINLWHSLLHKALNGHSGTTCAPLLVDDTTLLVDLGILKQQIVAPIVQNQQTRVDYAFALKWC